MSHTQRPTSVNSGLIIAITGIDGSGKSTLADLVAAHFTEAGRKVIRVSPGKPQGQLFEKVRVRLRGPRSARQSSDATAKRRTRLRDALPAIVLASMRSRLARRASRLAEAGTVVVADRWPTAEPGKMDGPRLGGNDSANLLLQWFAAAEHSIYRRLCPADLCILLRVPVEAAVQRNRSRVKADQESDDDIRRRHAENSELRPLARKTVTIDNVGPLEESLRRVLDLIESEFGVHGL